MSVLACLPALYCSRFNISKDTKVKTGMCAMKRNFRRPAIKREKFKGKTPGLKGHIFDKGYALLEDLYMNTSIEIAQYTGRMCKQPEEIMGAIKSLMEVVLVPPSMMTVDDPNDPMDQASIKIYLSKEIDLYLKHQDQYKEYKTKMFNVIIGQCTDLMISKLESEILWRQ
eukprot:2860141-Ditylum_brightwellii.AAC.1